jgi:sugar lactone lactonase YvrE
MSRRKSLFTPLVPSIQTVETRISTWSRIAIRGIATVAVLALGAAVARAQASFPNENVGVAVSQAVSVTISGTYSTASVLTLGQPNSDFTADAALTTCTSGSSGSCSVGVTFTPTAPGPRMGAIVVYDSTGSLVGSTAIYGTGLGPVAAFVPGYVTTYAGQVGQNLGLLGDGGKATSAELYLPSGVAFDGAGNLYIGDAAHNRVRMVCAAAASGIIKGTPAKCTAAGIIITVAGGGGGCSGEKDTFGDGCAATASTLSNPEGVTVDGAGNLYVTDTGNDLVREVNAESGVITVFAGNLSGTSGLCAAKTDSLGDGCPATQSVLNAPQGATFDVFGNLYIADTSNNRIRVVAPSGVITTVAGGGTGCGAQTDAEGDGCSASQAILDFPYPVAFDAAGNMYISDSSHNRVRMVAATSGAVSASSTISTFAGTGTASYTGDGGQAKAATLYAPSGVAIDPAQNVYIADTQNSAVRRVSVGTLDIETIINTTNNQTYQTPKTPPFVPLNFYEPVGLAFDGQGNLFIADTLEMVVQEMQSNHTIVDLLPPPATNAIRVDQMSAPQLITIENIGNSPLDLTAITPQSTPEIDAQVDAGTTTCVAGGSLGVGNPCIVGAVFAPTVAKDPLVTNIDVTTQTPNSPLDIEIVGDAEALNSTTTTITSNPNPSVFGQKVTFSVNITTGTGTLNGTVSITDTFNGTTATLTPAGGLKVTATGTSATATFAITTLGVGQHTIVAAYSGDASHTSSTSTDNGAIALTQYVDEVTATTLGSSANPSAPGQSVTFTATVTVTGGGGVTPDGSVTFMNGTTAMNSQPLPASGVVTYATSTLPLGNNSITAVYSGDATIEVLGSTSAPPLIQDVQTTTTSSVTGSPNPSTYGTQVNFIATVAPGTTTTVAPTGKVNFLDNGTQIGTGTLSGNPATAQYQTASLAVGTHPITVTYVGDNNFSGSTSAVVDNQVVNGTPTTIAVTANPNPGVAGVPEPITATVTSTATASLLTGSVTFTSNGTALGTGTLSNGTATINPPFAVGAYSIVATYAGNSNLGGSTSTAYSLSIVAATTTTKLTVTPTTAALGSTITFSATVTGNGVAPTGKVTFMAGTTVLGTPQTLTNGTAVLTDSSLAVGTYAITAVYSGDVNNGVSTSTATNLTIGLIATTTDLVATATTGTPPQVLLVGVVTGQGGPTPTGKVTFTTGSKTLGSATLDASGVATITPNLPNGSFQVVASYGGDAAHSPSQSAPVTVAGAPAQFSLTVAPATLSLAATQNGSVEVSVTSVGGFTDTVALGCASLPAGVTCTFANPSATLAANATAKSQLIIDTNSPLSGGTTAANSTRDRGFRLAGLFLPFSLIFGFAFWRLRRRTASLLTMVLVAALSLGALMATGCNSFGGSKVTPGTYTIQITGTGTQSDTIHYTTLTLNITK